MTSRIAVVAVVAFLIATLPAGVAAVGGFESTPDLEDGEPSPAVVTDAGVEPAATADADVEATSMADDVLHRTTELRHLSDRPGEFEAELTVAVPEPVSEVTIDLEPEADVQSLDGFEPAGDGAYRWTGETDAPTIRFTMPADRTGDDRSHVRSSDHGDGYTFVDTGDWGVVQVPNVGISYRKPDSVDIGLEETVAVDGPGAAGDDVAFFGAVTEHERTVDGEIIRLVVPDAADMEEPPEDVLVALAAASERLDVGSQPAETVVVAVPTDVDWGPRGVQYGQSDTWVRADAPLDEPAPVWLHEYVHVRQSFADDVAADAAWLVEAEAEYHAARLALETELTDLETFGRFLERGERSPYADGVLADPATWEDDRTDYVKGALVAGELDRQLRLETDGDRSLEDVVRQLNARDDRVTGTELLDAIEDAGGEAVRASAEEYTRTAATPETPTRSDQRAAFEEAGATIESEIGSEPIAVAGQDWERWDRDDLAGTAADIGSGDVLAVPAGERVAVPVALENVDDRAGTADPTLEVDGEIVAHDQVVVAGGEATTATLAWEPTEPGVYDVRAGSDRLTVYVRSTPSLTVTDLRVDTAEADVDESVTITATVTAADSLPAAGSLEARSAAGSSTAEPIALVPGDTGTVETELRFDDEGTYGISVGDRSTTVTVGGLVGGLESIPGFGVGAGLVALTVAVAIAAAGRRH